LHGWIHRPGRSRENEMVGLALANCFLVLSLLLGLVAVSTYQNYTNPSDAVDKEASTLAGLVADAAAFPPPHRTRLMDSGGGYIEATVEHDWPEMERGKTPLAGSRALIAISKVVLSFEPVTENQKILQAGLLKHLNEILEMRRSRISMMHLGLPRVLWWVVGFGVLLNLCLIWSQDMEVHVHYILGAVLSLSLGSVIFLTAVLENPFRGRTGIQPEAIQNVACSMETLLAKDMRAPGIPLLAAQLSEGNAGCGNGSLSAASRVSHSEADRR
jgi:hypothetical protein